MQKVFDSHILLAIVAQNLHGVLFAHHFQLDSEPRHHVFSRHARRLARILCDTEIPQDLETRLAGRYSGPVLFNGVLPASCYLRLASNVGREAFRLVEDYWRQLHGWSNKMSQPEYTFSAEQVAELAVSMQAAEAFRIPNSAKELEEVNEPIHKEFDALFLGLKKEEQPYAEHERLIEEQASEFGLDCWPTSLDVTKYEDDDDEDQEFLLRMLALDADPPGLVALKKAAAKKETSANTPAAKKGVSLQDAASCVRSGDPVGQTSIVDAWRKSRTPKLPSPIGKAPEHRQRNLYEPAALLEFLKQVEGAEADRDFRLNAYFRKVSRKPRG